MLEVPEDRTAELSNSKQPQTHFRLSHRGFLTQKVGVDLIPVERGERSAEVRVLVVVQQTFEARFCVADLCDGRRGVRQ